SSVLIFFLHSVVKTRKHREGNFANEKQLKIFSAVFLGCRLGLLRRRPKRESKIAVRHFRKFSRSQHPARLHPHRRRQFRQTHFHRGSGWSRQAGKNRRQGRLPRPSRASLCQFKSRSRRSWHKTRKPRQPQLLRRRPQPRKLSRSARTTGLLRQQKKPARLHPHRRRRPFQRRGFHRNRSRCGHPLVSSHRL